MAKSTFKKSTGDKICKLIINGESLRSIVKREDMPNRSTVHDWLSKNTSFADQYARACMLRRENKFEELNDIADTEDDVQRARLKVDVIKWQLSKEEPKKYGDKLELAGDEHNPLKVALVEFADADKDED